MALDQIGQETIQKLLDDYSENDSDRKWQIRYAVQAHRMLASKQHFDTVDLDVVKKRIIELTSVDLDELAIQFRDASETDRSNEWERLQPCLTGYLRSETKPDMCSFLISTLGEPSAEAHKHCYQSMGVENSDPDMVLCYITKRDGNLTEYLTVNIRESGVIFRGIVEVAPK